MQALLGALSVLLLLALLAAASFGARRLKLPPEAARKTVHVGLGLYCLTLPALFTSAAPVVATCAAAALLLLGVRAAKARGRGMGLAQGLHGVARQSYGELLFAAAVALLFVLGRANPITYALPLAILALSDAAAALVGQRYGRATFRIEDGTKSWEGAAIFFLTAWIIAMVLLLLLSDAPRLNVILLGAGIAAYGTLVEATSWRGWDNFLLPLAVHLLLAHNLDASPLVLLEGAGVSAAVLALLLAAGNRLRIGRHAAVFVSTVIATVAFASTTWNVAVPALALGCYLAVDDAPDGGDDAPHPHLALGLVFVGLSLGWYVLSDVTGATTIFAFNVSFGALGVALLAAHGRPGPALAMVPVVWAVVEARVMLVEETTPTGPAAMAVLLLLLLGSVAVASLARRWCRPVACEGLGGLALVAGAFAFPFAQ